MTGMKRYDLVLAFLLIMLPALVAPVAASATVSTAIVNKF
jgi:hypothetical protein